MKTVAANARLWLAGTFVALLGVAVSRVIAPRLAPSLRLTWTIAGQLLALAGLALLCIGVSRRAWRDEHGGPR